MIQEIVGNPAMSRMGWALLHFLWQGTVIALALKGVLMLLEQRSCRLRYALALACLFLMALLPVFLLCKPQNKISDIPVAYEAMRLETVPAAESTPALVPFERKPDFRADAFAFTAPLVPWLALFWLLGAALLLLKTVGGIIRVGILKKNAAAHCEAKGAGAFHRLAARAKIAPIPIVESGLVAIPTVAGWFKPVVLLPRGVPEKIDRAMLDALVAHEFSHVRRHDSLVNLFQTVIENLLFFHPAMWWVTRTVRAEREACCDDDAVAMCGNTLVYVRALSQAEQFRSSIPVIALSSSPLLHRIRRLTEMKFSKMNRGRAFCVGVLAGSFILALAAGSLLLATIPQQNSNPGVAASVPSGAQANRATASGREIQYSLLCGIVFGTRDKATGKPVFFPPPDKDGKFSGATCMLFDVSGPKPSPVTGDFQASKLIDRVEPVYPDSAIKRHVGIRVMLNISLNEEGRVVDAQVTKSQTVPPDTDDTGRWVGGTPAGVVKATNAAAVDAVKQWKYSPTLLNGKAILVKTTVGVTFTYNKDGSPKVIAPLF